MGHQSLMLPVFSLIESMEYLNLDRRSYHRLSFLPLSPCGGRWSSSGSHHGKKVPQCSISRCALLPSMSSRMRLTSFLSISITASIASRCNFSVEFLVLHGVAPICDHLLDVRRNFPGPFDALQRSGCDVGVGGHELHVQRHQRHRCGLEVRFGWSALPLLAAADATDDMQIEAEPFAGVALGGG